MKRKEITKVIIYYSDGTFDEIKSESSIKYFDRPPCLKCGKHHESLPCQHWDSFFHSTDD